MQRQSLGIAVVLSLIALRVGIGTHFFREGLNKLRDPKPFTAGFFGAAKGPFADTFAAMVWDRDGIARLDEKNAQAAWDQYRAQVERHYGFSDDQKKQAALVLKRTEDQLTEHLAANAGEIDEYRKNLARRDKYRADRQRMETPSLRDQVDKIEGEIRSKRPKLTGPIDLMWQGLARDLNALATPDQRSQGALTLTKPGRRMLDSEGIDAFIPWFDTILGVLLIIGLGTRLAAVAGAGFLFSVVATQWPTTAGAAPTWSQFIEALALLVVAAMGAGRFAGIDGLIGACCCRTCCSTSKTSATKPTAA